MAYYSVKREYPIIEYVIVKANNKFEAYEKATNDIDCSVKKEVGGDYEVDFESISLIDTEE